LRVSLALIFVVVLSEMNCRATKEYKHAVFVFDYICCIGGFLSGVFFDWQFSLSILFFVTVHAVVDSRLEAYIEREAQKYPVGGAHWSDWRVMEQVYANKPWV